MKLLSVNLWYEKYKNKTDDQLAAFRRIGYETYVATFINDDKGMYLYISQVSDGSKDDMVENHESSDEEFGSHKNIDRHVQ